VVFKYCLEYLNCLILYAEDCRYIGYARMDSTWYSKGKNFRMSKKTEKCFRLSIFRTNSRKTLREFSLHPPLFQRIGISKTSAHPLQGTPSYEEVSDGKCFNHLHVTQKGAPEADLRNCLKFSLSQKIITVMLSYAVVWRTSRSASAHPLYALGVLHIERSGDEDEGELSPFSSCVSKSDHEKWRW